MRYQTVWEFRTRNFVVTCDVAPEIEDPKWHFDFPIDIEAIQSGEFEWFCVRVAVHLLDSKGGRGNIVGADYLGGCAYKTFREFYASHRDADPLNRNCSAMRATRGDNAVICHYFPGMVSEAIAAARKTLSRIPKLRAA